MSVYRVIEIIGTSPTSWADAARTALSAAAHLRDLRVAEIVGKDITLDENGAIERFRTKLRLSFGYEDVWDRGEAEGPMDSWIGSGIM